MFRLQPAEEHRKGPARNVVAHGGIQDQAGGLVVLFMYFSSRDAEMSAMNNSHIYRTFV